MRWRCLHIFVSLFELRTIIVIILSLISFPVSFWNFQFWEFIPTKTDYMYTILVLLANEIQHLSIKCGWRGMWYCNRHSLKLCSNILYHFYIPNFQHEWNANKEMKFKSVILWKRGGEKFISFLWGLASQVSPLFPERNSLITGWIKAEL